MPTFYARSSVSTWNTNSSMIWEDRTGSYLDSILWWFCIGKTKLNHFSSAWVCFIVIFYWSLIWKTKWEFYYGIGSIICVGYFYIILIRIIIIIGITKSKYALQNPNQKNLKATKWYLWTELINLFKALMANITNYDLWCLIPSFIFALTAISYRPYFFIFCIIVFIIYSNSLMEVVLALWKPKERILWTLFLTMCVFYIYSVISLALFRNDYSQNISNSWDTVFNCYVTIADQWYKNNGLGGFLSINVPAISKNSKFSINWGRFSFDLIFFIVVPTLLINIIFSIIIDNFAETRSKRDRLREIQLSQCFVCGKLDNDIEDFSQHTKYLHNCWDYVYYIGYLNNTAYEDLVDYVDFYVKRMIENNKLEWFPCYFRENNKNFSITSPIQGISSRLEMLEKSNIEINNNIIEIKENNLVMKYNYLEIESKIDNRFGKIEDMLSQLLASQSK